MTSWAAWCRKRAKTILAQTARDCFARSAWLAYAAELEQIGAEQVRGLYGRLSLDIRVAERRAVERPDEAVRWTASADVARTLWLALRPTQSEQNQCLPLAVSVEVGYD